MEELADNGLPNGMVAESKQQEQASNKRKRSIGSLRRKRIKRNKEKRERRRNLSKDERCKENVEKISGHFKEEIHLLECSLQISKADYRMERKISAFYWNKCMEQGNIQSNHQSSFKVQTVTIHYYSCITISHYILFHRFISKITQSTDTI